MAKRRASIKAAIRWLIVARYQLTKQLAVQANVNNVFDRTYYSWLSDYAVYGDERNYSVNLSYAF